MKHIKAHAAKMHSIKEHKVTGGGIHHGSTHAGHAHGDAAHSDVAADRAIVRQMVKPSALEHHAHGGRVKKGPHHSQVNVIVAPKGDQQPVPMPVPIPGGGAPIRPPLPMAGPMAGPMGGPMGGGMPPISPGGVPPLGGRAGPMRHGGHVHKHK